MTTDNEIPKDPAMRWEWIKFQLRTHGTSLSDLARKLEVERNALHNVKRLPYPRMESAIAKALGMKPYQIWPDRWAKDGTPLRRSSRSDSASEND